MDSLLFLCEARKHFHDIISKDVHHHNVYVVMHFGDRLVVDLTMVSKPQILLKIKKGFKGNNLFLTESGVHDTGNHSSWSGYDLDKILKEIKKEFTVSGFCEVLLTNFMEF